MRKLLKITPIMLLGVLCIGLLINAAALTPGSGAPIYSLQRSTTTRLAGPSPSWSKTYGDTEADSFLGMVACSSGGYALVGETSSWGAGSADAYLARVDANGNLLWNTTIGGTEWDRGQDIIEVSDGYVIVGTTESWGSGFYDVWLFKTDLNGNHVWNRTFGSCGFDFGYSLVECADGNFTLVGILDNGASGYDLYLVHTNTTGHDYWTKTIGDTESDHGYDLVECTGGGYAIAGYTLNYGATNGGGWLVRTDASGNHQYNHTFGGASNSYCYSIIECSDGGFALAGWTTDYGVNDHAAWLIKTNAAGMHQWNHTYDAFGLDKAYDVIEYSEGGFMIAGFQEHPYTLTKSATIRSPSPYDGLLLRTDTNGNQIWNSTYGASGEFDDEAYWCLVEDSTGAILAGGETTGLGAGDFDAWLVKTGYPLAWNPAPTDQTVLQGLPVVCDLDVDSHFSIASWSLNDTAFAIDSNGVVSIALPLPVGVYGLSVTVTDAVGSEITGEFTVTIVASLIPYIPVIAGVVIVIIVVILLLLYYFVLRKRK